VTARSQGSKPIYPPTFLLVAVMLMIGLHFLAPVRQVILSSYRWLGVIPIAGGVAMVLWAAGIFRHAGTTIKPFEESTDLITRGPYRVTRNPIYLSMVCALVGVAVVAGSLTPFLVVPLFAYLIDRRFIRAEEAMLEQTFGAEYAAYKAGVRRWL
jgi:protein-S-isoprenylcysteine O-methyltransferase Ste14